MLKLIHTSDWHLGKSIHGQSLTEDQGNIVESMVERIEREYHCIIIAGDLYDRAVPPTEAVDLLSNAFTNLSEKGIEVIAIPGNHDSPKRIGFASSILEKKGIHIRTHYTDVDRPIILEDQNDTAHVYCLPFVDETMVRSEFPGDDIGSHQQATAFLLDLIRERKDSDVVNILVAHAFTGWEPKRSESERELILGNQGLVDSSVFRGFDHVAMGHLHRPQTASKENNIHYSGSIMPYSFSEVDDEKSIISIEINGNSLERKIIPIQQHRRFSKISGFMEVLLNDGSFDACRDDYLSVEIRDRGFLLDIHRRLRERFPHILEIIQPALMGNEMNVDEDLKKAMNNPQELFDLFLTKFGWEGKGRKIAHDIFRKARERLERDEREASS